MNFPSNFDIRLPIVFIGQKIVDGRAQLHFDIPGFDVVGLGNPTLYVEFEKDNIARLSSAAVVMTVRKHILEIIGRGLGMPDLPSGGSSDD